MSYKNGLSILGFREFLILYSEIRWVFGYNVGLVNN